MEIVNLEHNTSIPDFYKGKNVFFTGATGFLGKVMVDKLLRSCPDIGNIYILIRPKKGKDLKERVEQMLKDQLFDTLKQTCPSQLSKLIPLKGDTAELNLGLSEADYETITSSVSIIYHVAASVRFDDSLKYAIIVNTRGTREVAHLALRTRDLSVFVHVSTTYCNCVVGEKVEEKIYPASDDWRRAIKIAEEFDNEQLTALTDKYLGPYPNTYTFSKALGEHVVKDLCEGKIPTVICRPSIVINTMRDPVEGWIDNFNGPVGLLLASGKGLLRCTYLKGNIRADFLPVDITAKIILVATWDLGLRQQRNNLEVIHCSNNYILWLSFEKLINFGKDINRDIPLNNSLWLPKGCITGSASYAYFCIIFFHLLPALFLDLALKLSGNKTIFMRLQTKIYNAALQLRYFTFQEWDFPNNKMMALLKKIIEEDKKDWGYDFRGEDVQKIFRNSVIGSRKYLLHEPEDTLPQARIHYKRMYWLDKITMTILYGSLFWLIIHFGLIEIIINRVYNCTSYYFDGLTLANNI